MPIHNFLFFFFPENFPHPQLFFPENFPHPQLFLENIPTPQLVLHLWIRTSTAVFSLLPSRCLVFPSFPPFPLKRLSLFLRGGGCNSRPRLLPIRPFALSLRSFFSSHFSRVFFSLRSLPSRVLDTDRRPSFRFVRSARCLRREPFVPPFVCALVEGQLSHPACARSLAHLSLLLSHSLISFHRSCVLSSKHSHRLTLSIRIPRETSVESLTVVSRASLSTRLIRSPLPFPSDSPSSCPLMARNPPLSHLPLVRRSAALPPRPSMSPRYLH